MAEQGRYEEKGEPKSADTEEAQDDMTVPVNITEYPEEEIPTVFSSSGAEDQVGLGIEQATDLTDQGFEELVSPPTHRSGKQMAHLKVNATVKFVLMPTGQVVTMACVLGQPLWELKVQFAGELKMPPEYLLLKFNGKSLSDTTTVADLGAPPCGTIQLEMHSTDPEGHPIRPYKFNYEYQMPDIIAVRVQTEKGGEKSVVVEIVRETERKRFLGGFHDKFTGKEFHNASMQAPRILRITYELGSRFDRDSQTTELRHRFQQTFNDTSTQMTGIGVYVPNLDDKLLEPKDYTSADAYKESVLQKVIIIQKNYRRWLAIRRVRKLREAKRRVLEWDEEQERLKKDEAEYRVKREFERRMRPRTKEDFDLLYAALEKWRLEELERINSSLTGAERKAALYMLLEHETQLLASIDRHRMEAQIENSCQSTRNFLNKTADPVTWRGFDGQPTQMVTAYTLRAKDLRDIYDTLTLKYLTQDERLDILLTLKYTIQEHECTLTRDIAELIDREADLLMRRVKEDNLTGLRKRIATLFLQYIKTPAFNPEAAKFIKIPRDPMTLRKNIYHCPSCSKYLPSFEFKLSTNSRNSGKCRDCVKLDNDARMRLDLSHFRRMLKALRVSEDAYEDGSQFAFLMTEKDMRYLVEYIWGGDSVLSAWKDLYDLVLVRWDKDRHWSPWNCILLTAEEAKSHAKIDDLEETYEAVFIHRVKQKHTWARRFFSKLKVMVKAINMEKKLSLSPDPSHAARNLVSKQVQTY